MSDQDEDVRLLATNTFATLVKLVPLEGSVRDPEDISEELLKKKAQERRFLDQLMNVKNLEDSKLDVQVDAELRKYQRDGVNWYAIWRAVSDLKNLKLGLRAK
jgi:TATA-binding protein-associated factor